MCLSLTGQVVELDGSDAVVDVRGRRLVASCLLEPETRLRDWVTVGAGWIVARLSPEEAAIRIDLERQLYAPDASNAPAPPPA